MSHSKSTALFFILLFWSLTHANAQMRAPREWSGYENVLRVKNGLRGYDFDVSCIRTSSPANVFWPGEKVSLTIQIVNNTAETLEVEGRIDIIRYGTVGRPNDIWQPDMIKLADSAMMPVRVKVPANGFMDVDINPVIPEVFGGYALVLDLGKSGRRLITGIVRTFKPDAQPVQYPKQALDDIGADFLSRIGVQAIRMGISYIPTEHRDFVREMELLDKKLREYRDNNITVLLMFMEGPALIPLGSPRSFLDEKGVFLKTKQDYVWLPQLDDDFREFVKRICLKHGWPRGCVTGVHLWNEPWEGNSISGWQSDMLRYREIYKAMAGGVLEARREGADVLIGGCDSHSNAIDKLFPDGKSDFLPIFDFLSIHYEGMESPCLYPEWNNRKDHKGRVLIWDTESWVGNTDDRIATVVATNRSVGYDRSMGIYGGYMISRPHTGEAAKQLIRSSSGWEEIDAVPSVWSPAAAMGAVQKMIGEREFRELLFKNGLPWIMLFDGGQSNPDDGTAVVCGDIGDAFGTDNVLFRNVRLKSGGKMSIKSDPAFHLYDFYGNPVAGKGATIEIPLSFQGYFLRTDGSKGSFSRLTDALDHGFIEGYVPVEIICRDMTERVETHPVVDLQLTNILNRTISGTLVVHVGNLIVQAPPPVTLKPNETRNIQVKISGGKPSAGNTYPLEVVFDAGSDGKATHKEDMHVNMISNIRIQVDGRLDEWGGALPQTVTAGKASLTGTESAWYPFKQFDTKAEGVATGYLAYDEQYFYFAAKSADNTPHPGTYRFETRNDDEFFYPDTAYKPDPNLSYRKQDGKIDVRSGDESALQHPTGTDRLMQFWEPDKNHIGIGADLQLPSDSTTRVAFYLPNIQTGRTDVEVTGLPSGKVLLSHAVSNLWKGCYLVFELSGNIRITFRGDWWYQVKLAAVFFDKGKPNASESASAFLVQEDFDTRGNWKGKFGGQGYWIFGAEPELPQGVRIAAVDHSVLIPMVWPEGVRHFTYRKDPVLPDNSSGIGYAYDNVQIAFNVIPIGEDGYGSHPKGTMPRYIGYKCTDYEYALNQVAPEYGGGTEIWRLLVPGMPRKHFYPRQPKSPFDGPVKSGKLAVTHEGNTRITECAIPWSEIPDVKKALDAGQKIKFSFRVNDNGAMGNCLELARDRSVSKRNGRAFHADWKEHWANEVEFGFEKIRQFGSQ